MPPRKTVPSLRVRALDVTCSFIVAQVQLRRSVGAKPSSALSSAFPSALLSDLLSEILLRRSDLEAEERLAVLRLLLRSDVRALWTGTFPATLHVAVLDTIRRRGAGLRHLDLRGVWTRDGGAVSAAALVAMISVLPRLQVLSAPHSCSDALLVALASHCHHLQVLDASGEGTISPDGVEALAFGACASTLEKVDLGCRGEVRVEPDVVAQLLLCAPRLRSLGSYAYTGTAVGILPSDCLPTQLTYLRDTGTTLKTADAVIRHCTRLRSMYLDSPQVGVLPVLAELASLRAVKLRAFRLDQLLLFLKKAGARILSLELVGACDERLPLESVAGLCPNIERLDCGQVAVEPHLAASTRFPSLRSFRIGKASITASTLRTLARAAPKLESLVILTPMLDLEDNDMKVLAAEGLAEVWFTAAPRLTQDAILTLMSSAPRLKVIGDLAGWDIDVLQIIQMRSLMAECNLDLALWTSDALDQGDDVDAQHERLVEEYLEDLGL